MLLICNISELWWLMRKEKKTPKVITVQAYWRIRQNSKSALLGRTNHVSLLLPKKQWCNISYDTPWCLSACIYLTFWNNNNPIFNDLVVTYFLVLNLFLNLSNSILHGYFPQMQNIQTHKILCHECLKYYDEAHADLCSVTLFQLMNNSARWICTMLHQKYSNKEENSLK